MFTDEYLKAPSERVFQRRKTYLLRLIQNQQNMARYDPRHRAHSQWRHNSSDEDDVTDTNVVKRLYIKFKNLGDDDYEHLAGYLLGELLVDEEVKEPKLANHKVADKQLQKSNLKGKKNTIAAKNDRF